MVRALDPESTTLRKRDGEGCRSQGKGKTKQLLSCGFTHLERSSLLLQGSVDAFEIERAKQRN